MLRDLGSNSVSIILDAVNLIDSAHTDEAELITWDAVRRLGSRVCVLHMKDFTEQPEAARPKPVACGLGEMKYGALLALARERNLPMTLENTTPENAEKTRLFLESFIRNASGKY